MPCMRSLQSLPGQLEWAVRGWVGMSFALLCPIMGRTDKGP